MKTLLLTIMSLTFVFNAMAQTETPFSKSLFKERKAEFKEAREYLEQGDQFFIGVTNKYLLPEYENAIEPYKKAYAFNPNSSELNFKLGICFMNSSHKYKSLDFFKKAYRLNTSIDPTIHMYMGMSYHIQYKFNKAKEEYELYRETLNTRDHSEEIKMATKKIGECTAGQKMYNNPVRVWIDNLGAAINSEHAEYAPLITTDESSIFFTARREDTEGGKRANEDDKFFEDIYRAEFKDGKWQEAINIGTPINGESHDATAGLSPDGNTLFVYEGKEGGGDIFVSKYVDGLWTKPKHLGKNINDKNAHESSACLSFDGKSLYFASSREGGVGGHDLYVSRWDTEKERWGEAINMGTAINTAYDEVGVFIHPDGKTLYFASKGHSTMGGYDIFYAVKENGVWGEPVNVGYPVNTPDDDVHFVVSANGRTGYFASFHEDGLGEKDLYKVTFLGPEKMPLLNNEDNLIASIASPIKEKVVIQQVEVTRSDVAILKGVVKDAKTKAPLSGIIEIIDNTTNEIVSTIKADSKSGKYLATLPSGKNYGMSVKSDGYLFHSENFLIPEASGYREYNKDIDLKKVEVGSEIVLRNIFFDLSKATLRPESKAELERLIKLMTENPTLKIEISGHTDSRGDKAMNQDLSQRRAQAVLDYLVNNAVAKDRMVSAGYGETKLLISDQKLNTLPKLKREDAHQQNRRTAFKILSK